MVIWVRDLDGYLKPGVPRPKGMTKARAKSLQRKFAKFLAERYKEELREAVLRQSLASTWKPLSKSYQEHKIRTGLNPGMWIATSKLIESVVVIETPMRIEVGVDRRKTHNGTRLHLIAQALEYGAGSIPPRPLFMPVYRKLVKSMPDLVEEFMRKERRK